MSAKKDSLFELSGMQAAINRAIEDADGDLDEAGVEDLMDQNYPKLLDKLRAYGWMIESASIELAEVNVWVERLQARQSAVSRVLEDLRRRMAEGMARADVKRVEGQDRPLNVARVLELARKAAGLKKATDRAQRNEVLDELLLELDAKRPPISWKLSMGRGKVTEDQDFSIEALETWAGVMGFDLVVHPPQPAAPPPRVDKTLAGKLLKDGEEIPGLSLVKTPAVKAGE